MDSHVVHAVSSTALGPYKYVDTSLPPEATCMHIMLLNRSRIVMYHQGRSGATSAAALHNCTKKPYAPPHHEEWRRTPQHKVHYSDSPAGPWLAGTADTPMPPGINCENPAPLLLPNGSIAVFCHGPGIRLWLSGTDQPVRFIATEGSYPIPHTVWEDPSVYLDSRGNWHLLSHVYPTNTSSWLQYADIVAGHAFSRDGIDWHFHRTPPWTANVTNVDGSTRHYATRERPFLLLTDDAERAPVALFTSVTLPGRPKQNYTRDGGDYSFTHVQPVQL